MHTVVKFIRDEIRVQSKSWVSSDPCSAYTSKQSIYVENRRLASIVAKRDGLLLNTPRAMPRWIRTAYDWVSKNISISRAKLANTPVWERRGAVWCCNVLCRAVPLWSWQSVLLRSSLIIWLTYFIYYVIKQVLWILCVRARVLWICRPGPLSLPSFISILLVSVASPLTDLFAQLHNHHCSSRYQF